MSVELKPLYSIAELAKLFRLHRNQVVRLLESADVQFTMVGNRRHVALEEIQAKLPAVWNSVFLARKAA